jgi:hypothetical protein
MPAIERLLLAPEKPDRLPKYVLKKSPSTIFHLGATHGPLVTTFLPRALPEAVHNYWSTPGGMLQTIHLRFYEARSK